jgi:DNA-binding response OmpR family regulator
LKIPFVVLTAHHDDESERRSLRAGASAIFRKPFSPDELLTAVRSMLSGPSA